MNDNEQQFIIELEALSRKHKLVIAGCGCCGSPSVEQMKESEEDVAAGYCYDSHLLWASPEEFGWDYEGYMYKDKVVK